MTLLQHYAGLAMQELLGAYLRVPGKMNQNNEEAFSGIAEASLLMADAMLKAQEED